MAFKLFVALFVIAGLGFWLGRGRAWRYLGAGHSLHSQPLYHGLYVAAWAFMPALLLLLLWLGLKDAVLAEALWRTVAADAAEAAGTADLNRDLILAEIGRIARGLGNEARSDYVRAAAARLARWNAANTWIMAGATIAVALAGLAVTLFRLAPATRVRQRVERILSGILVGCAGCAILVTAGIFISLVIEAYRFFEFVPVHEFLFGLNWEPQIAIRADQVAGQGAFGAVPVFTGTLLIASIALAVAIPIGLFSAIYLSQFATPRMRAQIKPVIELLAGVPTVVYGFFAVTVLAPFARDMFSGLGISPTSALVAGCTMGVMLIPFISSLSEDAISAVPRAMRDGSLAMGATVAETVKHVLLPAALPGIMGGILLAASRAIGETMIVVMAAGIIANLTINPLDNASTVTVQIVTLLIGDTEFDNPKTLAAFALGFVLFLVTLVLNVIALRIVQKYRERYE